MRLSRCNFPHASDQFYWQEKLFTSRYVWVGKQQFNGKKNQFVISAPRQLVPYLGTRWQEWAPQGRTVSCTPSHCLPPLPAPPSRPSGPSVAKLSVQQPPSCLAPTSVAAQERGCSCTAPLGNTKAPDYLRCFHSYPSRGTRARALGRSSIEELRTASRRSPSGLAT